MCAFDAVCPAGKGAAKWRAGYGRVAEKSGSSKRFAHQGALPARRGRRSPFAPFSMKDTAALSSAYERRMVHRPASSAAAFSPCRPAGRTAGSARTRPRDQSLGNPFWGTGLVFPRLPSPKTPQAAGPCSWACRRLPAPPSHAERNEAPMPPARGAWVRIPRAKGTGCRHCRLKDGKVVNADFFAV